LALVLIRPTFGLPKLLSLFGLILLLFVNNYISFFLSLECQSLLLYLLASRDSISSGLKYFIIGSFSSSLILFGISLLYLYSGFTDISLIHDLDPQALTACSVQPLEVILSSLPTSSPLLFGHQLILLGLFIKLGVPPFHL
jgi:NADH-quinone oxidoreductase subunit N